MTAPEDLSIHHHTTTPQRSVCHLEQVLIRDSLRVVYYSDDFRMIRLPAAYLLVSGVRRLTLGVSYLREYP